jgi:tRNA nucleotidyltransferase/poly(A) polymerase
MKWREELTRRFPALAYLPQDAYVVGGAVRDLLLGREPDDVDVAAPDALPCANALGRKVIQLGVEERLRAYRVVDGDRVYDFADLLDGSLDADLRRRDFTINAMAVDLVRDELVDHHGGEADLGKGIVRMVEAKNFDDDPLRLLKAVRMAVKYGFTIAPETLQAIRSRAPKIVEVAVERVTFELTAIFSTPATVRAVKLLRETGLDRPLFGKQLETPMANAVPLAGILALLVDDPKAYAERWRWSDALLRDVQAMQRLLGTLGHDPVALYNAGEAVARALPATLLALDLDPGVEMPDFATRALLDGAEIAAVTGLAEGKDLGAIKRALLEAQLRGEVRDRDEAEAFVKRAKT